MKILCCFKNTRQQQLQKKTEPEAKDTTEHSSEEASLKEEPEAKYSSQQQESRQCECADIDKFHKEFKELIEGYENDKGKYVDMSQPRDASYASKTEISGHIKKTKRLGEDVHLSTTAKHEFVDSFDPSSHRPMKTEVRGITLRQLRAIIHLIKRRCEEEKWTRLIYINGDKTDEVEVEAVTLENATLYDINKYIIKPFTQYSQKSFVETLPSTKGTQRPRWFVR